MKYISTWKVIKSAFYHSKMVTIKIKRSSRTIQSAEIVGSNDDLLTEILLRLPIRSILYFKSVSKHWLSLITNPYLSLRITNLLPPSGLFLQSSVYPVPEYEYVPFDVEIPSNPPFKTLTFPPDHSHVMILNSCNGLLCCRCLQRSEYYVYNPTTKQFTTLPPIPSTCRTSKPSRIFCMILAFDPSRSPHYKVICVRNRGSKLDNRHYQIEIYSSEGGPWRVCGQPFTAIDADFSRGVYWNGGIHWTSSWGNSLHFKIDEERVERIPMPPLPDRWDDGCNPSYFGESHGHLHLVEAYGPRATQLYVSEMESDYSGWCLKYQVDLDQVPITFPEMVRSSLDPMDRNYYVLEILGLVHGEKEEDSFIVLEIPGKALRYNIADKTFKKLCEFSSNQPESGALDTTEGYLRFGGGVSFQYIESLSCI